MNEKLKEKMVLKTRNEKEEWIKKEKLREKD